MSTLPVARQGAAFKTIVATEALKGLTAAQTPSGSWRTSFTKPVIVIVLACEAVLTAIKGNTYHHQQESNLPFAYPSNQSSIECSFGCNSFPASESETPGCLK